MICLRKQIGQRKGVGVYHREVAVFEASGFGRGSVKRLFGLEVSIAWHPP